MAMFWNNPNRPETVACPRPDEGREPVPPETGVAARDGYVVLGRKPRLADYPDYVSPDRAAELEGIARMYDAEDYD